MKRGEYVIIAHETYEQKCSTATQLYEVGHLLIQYAYQTMNITQEGMFVVICTTRPDFGH